MFSGGTVALGEWGDVPPRGGAPEGPLVEDVRRRRLSPALGRPPWVAVSSACSSSSLSSLTEGPEGPPLMERPPGMFAAGGGPGMLNGPELRLTGGPTGRAEGTAP